MPPTNPAADRGDGPVEERAPPDSEALRKFLPHPPTAVMVKEALEALDSRKGVTTLAMYNFVKQKYPSVDMGRSKALIRKALRKGLENGTFVRPPNSSEGTGSAKGRFRLARVKKSRPKNENVAPNDQDAPEPAKVAPKRPQKAGAANKDSAREPTQAQEDSKPLKKPKKAEGSATTKAAPAKKPKAKMAAAKKDGEQNPKSIKPKGGGQAASASQTKPATTREARTVKASRSKTPKAVGDIPASKAAGKPRKKAGE